MNVYIDLGAWCGVTVQERLRETDTDEAIFAFEPAPQCAAHPRWAALERDERVRLIRAAAGAEAGMCELYINPARPDSQSATIMPGKKTGGVDYRASVTVPVIDFDAWIRAACSATDHITMKMDVEGAEYDIIDAMIRSGTIAWIDELRIEFHAHKLNIPGIKDRHDRTIDYLQSLPIILKVEAH